MALRAVLILNLGSPDSPSVADVRRYLKEFLLDERVIDSPPLIRNLVVRGCILPKRPKNTAEAYSKIWTDRGSPLIVLSNRMREKVRERVDMPVELAMRYGNPSIPDAINRIAERGVTHLFIMPMYPHYAMSSYETVVVKVEESIREKSPHLHRTLLQPFYRDSDYIEALSESVAPYISEDPDKILFSYHGLPERHLKKTDPSHQHCQITPNCCSVGHPAHATCYRHQCLKTTEEVCKKLNIPTDRHTVSFQSRLGRDPWLKPYTDFVLTDFPRQGIKKIAVICPAFVTDCLETLEEIDLAGRKEFLAAGGESFTMIPCLNDQPVWINWLVKRIRRWSRKIDSLPFS